MDNQCELIKNIISSYSDENNSENNIKEALEPAAKKYSIVLIKADLFCTPPRSIIIYRDKDNETGEDYACYSEKIDTYKASITCYAKKGISWNKSDKSFLELLCQILYCLLLKKIYCKISRSLYYYDYRTGLPNANSIKKFGTELNSTMKIVDYCALLVNIKGTNYLSKKVGFTAVTQLIKTYASILQRELDSDEMAAKISEDIFFIILKKDKTETIVSIADGTEVKCTLDEKEYTFNIQARIAIYNFTKNVSDFDKVFSSLTAAMNYARNVSHEDIIVCSDELEQHIVRTLGYTQLFRESLDKGDFFVMFQPKVLTTDNTLYGAEALVRWQRGEEVIMPSSFISTLEREHLVCRLDWYVLEHTCKCIQKWITNGLTPVRISVNFSNDHLLEQDIAGNIEKIVDKYHVPHEYIEIEITETVDSEDVSKLFEFVDNLRKMNFHVSIDDFGIGYSSLHLLNSVTVDVLKIDKAFVNKITEKENKKERIIIQNIINMASELGIEVVAEGVETEPQIEALKELSCFRIQGFIFDKPLSEDSFAQRLSAKKY